MADEATVNAGLTIKKGNLFYRSGTTQFKADITTAKGPVPGAITCAVAGTDVTLTELTTPALCKITNLDTTNYIDVGIWDGVSFYPMLELQAGETYTMRISRNLAEEYGVGTGTTGAAINTLRIKANTAACEVVVACFDA